MSEGSSVDELARDLISTVRDRAIDSCDQLAEAVVRGSLGERWRGLVDSSAAREVALELIPDVVDQMLFHLLDAIDNERLPLGWKRADSFEGLADIGHGEMAGRLMMGEGGWIDQHSAKPHFDPLADSGDAL